MINVLFMQQSNMNEANDFYIRITLVQRCYKLFLNKYLMGQTVSVNSKNTLCTQVLNQIEGSPKIEKAFQLVEKSRSNNGLEIYYEKKVNNLNSKSFLSNKGKSFWTKGSTFSQTTTSKQKPKLSIHCKSKVFNEEKIEIENRQNLISKQACSDYTLKMLNCNYDIKTQCLYLLQKKKQLEELNKSIRSNKMFKLQTFEAKGDLFCSSRGVIRLLFQNSPHHSMKKQIQFRRSTMNKIEQNLVLQQIDKITLRSQILFEHGFSVREILEIAKFLIDVVEQILIEFENYPQKGETIGKILDSGLHIDNILYAKNNELKLRNIFDSFFFYPHHKIISLNSNQQQPTFRQNIMSNNVIFMIGMCLLSCSLLEDTYEECVYLKTGQVCLSAVQQKIDELRQFCSGCPSKNALANLIQSLLLWQQSDDFQEENVLKTDFQTLKQIRKEWNTCVQSLNIKNLTNYQNSHAQSLDTRQMLDDVSSLHTYNNQINENTKYSYAQNKIHTSKKQFIKNKANKSITVDLYKHALTAGQGSGWKIENSETKKIQTNNPIKNKITNWKNSNMKMNEIEKRENENKENTLNQIDMRWKFEESMFENMPEFPSQDEKMFSFDVDPDFKGKIERRTSGVGLSLCSNRL